MDWSLNLSGRHVLNKSFMYNAIFIYYADGQCFLNNDFLHVQTAKKLF